MKQMTEERTGITQGKSPLIKLARKIIFIKMLCSPIFILLYLFFCRTLYRFCMYGNVKKRGTILGICIVFFIIYLVIYLIRIHKIELMDTIPEEIGNIRDYGFNHKHAYFFSKEGKFYATKCDDKERDYIRLKYSELPKYRYFFWKIPAYILLAIITVMTIIGVVKSSMHFNGKLAWYLFDLQYNRTVEEKNTEAEKSEAKWRYNRDKEVRKNREDTDLEVVIIDNIKKVPEEETKEEILQDYYPEEVPQEDISDEEPEVIAPEALDERLYGNTDISEINYKNEDGDVVSSYSITRFYFDGKKYRKVNKALKKIYQEKEQEYIDWYEKNNEIGNYKTGWENPGYEEQTWYLEGLEYVGDDYVSLLFNNVYEWPDMPHSSICYTPITIDISTGEVVAIDDILEMSWNEIMISEGQNLGFNEHNYGFYLNGDKVYFIYRYNYFEDQIVVDRGGK